MWWALTFLVGAWAGSFLTVLVVACLHISREIPLDDKEDDNDTSRIIHLLYGVSVPLSSRDSRMDGSGWGRRRR
jgi:hypothetical protein